MTQRQYWRQGWDNVIAVADSLGQPGAPWDGGVRNYVYDANSMAWIAMTASSAGTGTEVVVTSSALPSGASTATKQDTGNTSLASIDNKTPALVSGRQPVDGSGVTQPVSGTFFQATQPVSIAAAIPTKSPVNTTGSGSAAASTVSTIATITAPANAVGFILMNLDTSSTNMRWSVGRTASTTLGQQLQPGRDTGFVPIGANVSIIAESGTCDYDLQWVSQ